MDNKIKKSQKWWNMIFDCVCAGVTAEEAERYLDEFWSKLESVKAANGSVDEVLSWLETKSERQQFVTAKIFNAVCDEIKGAA